MFRTTSRLAHERVTVRHARPGDETAIERVAALDSAHAPVGPTLVAEADARILAALPLGVGRPVADPFMATAELVALLELRRAQLEREAGLKARRGLGERFRSLLNVPAQSRA